MSDLNLLDLVKLNNADPITGLVESAVWSKPELEFFPAVARPGINFQVARRTKLPTAQFAKPGAGVAPSKSTLVLDNHEMFYMNTQLEVPIGIIQGQNRAVGDILAIEADGTLNASFFKLCQQIWYGNKGSDAGSAYTPDPNGYPGAIQVIDEDEDYWIQKEGADGSSTSAFLVSLHEKGAHLSVGRDGNMTLLPWIQQQITLANGNKDQAMVSAFMGWFGFSVVNEFSVYRISGLDGTNGNTLNDALISDLLAKIPTQYRINLHLFTSRAGATQLQKSRTAINYQPAGEGGSVAYPPAPTSSNDIPLHVTEAISSVESNS